ncbi:ABC transporter permease [Tunicatimonas pelagia]|uniref:ABC transporter permease n=1 Tax=Tunicatimonas pelagia TaxID=931531 RepID=UPI0026663C2E|nr:ABC transporter permease [Tunicatimonas pelagia]WKN40763.1 ABC transporter permease [Tunicatimonas pelagia]
MLRSYLKIAYRNLLKNEVFSLINILGFLLGFVAAIFIALYVADELSFDAFHTNADRIYRITETVSDENGEREVVGAVTQIASAAVENFSEVENAARVTIFGRITLGYKEFRDYEPVWFAEPAFFEIFDFKFIEGDPKTALEEPFTIVLTERLAKKYFGNESPLGESMYANWFGTEVTVTGVIEDFPSNSHLNPPLLFSADFKDSFWAENDWSSSGLDTYLLLAPDAQPEELADQLTALANEHRPADQQQNQYHLQALTDIHFHSQHLENDTNAHKGDIAYVYVFTAIGLLILFIAFVNYVNLSTARAMKRSKEVGLRKTVGANRRQLIFQFMGESLLIVMLTLVVAVTLVQLLLPAFNQLSDKTLELRLFDSPLLLVLVFAGLISSLLAGIYPAFYLSGIKPSLILKQPSGNQRNYTFRQLLVVGQFAMAIVMITATVVIYRQMNFIRNTDLGYERAQRLTVDINSQPMWEKYESIKAAFQKIPTVENVTVTNRVPGEWKGIPVAGVKTEKASLDFLYFAADKDFLPTYDIQLLQGRNFRHTKADSAKVLLNETAVSAMGLVDPVGQLVEVTHFRQEKLEQPFVAEVIGVIQDVHFESVREKVAPTMITYYQNPLHRIDYYTLQIHSKDVQQTLADIKAVTSQFDPGSPLEYHFLDDQFEELYLADTKTAEIIGIAAALAIFIACMGLFGLTNLSVAQRTKEVGIRKVLGAEVLHLTWLIAKNFFNLVGIAFLIAAPFAWWLTRTWLSEFAYHINMSVTLLLLAGSIVLLIAAFTVSFQTIRAALANPVDSLRYE